MSGLRHSCALLALAALAACGPSVPFDAQSGDSTGDEPTDAPDGSTTAAQPEPVASSDESSGGPPSTFVDDPDGGDATFECSTFLQNCPAGEKCMYWADDDSGTWNATRCSPIDPDPDDVGEPCTVEGNIVSGIDSCVPGAMCWDVDPKTNEGYCVDQCTGSESEPLCSDPEMVCVGNGPYVCLPTCCPLEQDCVSGQACYPFNDSFLCVPDRGPTDSGYFGHSCVYEYDCDPGLVCVAADAVPGCTSRSNRCCTAFCEVGSASCSRLDPNVECVPWYEEGHAPPEYEFVGACMLPS